MAIELKELIIRGVLNTSSTQKETIANEIPASPKNDNLQKQLNLLTKLINEKNER